MGGIGAPSPGMVFVEKTARFTPRLVFRRRFFEKNSPITNEKPTPGRISSPNKAPKKRLVWSLGSSFLGIYDTPGAPSFPRDKWIFKNTWGQTLSIGYNFCGNLEFLGETENGSFPG